MTGQEALDVVKTHLIGCDYPDCVVCSLNNTAIQKLQLLVDKEAANKRSEYALNASEIA